MTDETPQVQQENPAPAPPSRHQATTLSEYLESLLITVILALFVTSFILQAFKIPSQSMEKTLLVGDHLLVNKFIFGGRGDAWYEKLLPYRPLQRGDIIVFKYPYDDHQHFVKRVIGLPGDRLKIVDRDVYINEKLLVEPYVVHDPSAGYDPQEPDAAKRVVRGGSFLCSDQYCSRYLVGSRGKAEVRSGASNLGFRTVR